MLAGSLGLKRTIFLRSILDNSLGLVITLFFSFLESTSRWSTDLPWFLGTPSDWCELLYRFLLNTAHLLGPFRTHHLLPPRIPLSSSPQQQEQQQRHHLQLQQRQGQHRHHLPWKQAWADLQLPVLQQISLPVA